MTIATDFAAYGASQKRISVTSTSATLGGTSGFLAEAIPDNVTHIALLPEDSGIRLNFGAAASATTFLIPAGGIVLNAETTAFDAIYLYAASTTACCVLLGGPSLRVFVGSSFSTGDIPLGAVEIKDQTAATRLGVYAEDAAHSSGDTGLMTLGVRTDTRASLAGATADYAPAQLTANGDVRTRDDDLNTVFGSALTFQTPVALTQAGAGLLTILALEAAKVIRLHALVLTMDTAAGTLKVSYDDDGAGTNEVNLTGVMALPLNGGVNIPFNANPSGCLKTAAGKQLTLTTTGGAVKGYAIVSKASA